MVAEVSVLVSVNGRGGPPSRRRWRRRSPCIHGSVAEVALLVPVGLSAQEGLCTVAGRGGGFVRRGDAVGSGAGGLDRRGEAVGSRQRQKMEESSGVATINAQPLISSSSLLPNYGDAG